MRKSTNKNAKPAAPRAIPMDGLKAILGGDPGKQGGHMTPSIESSTLPG